MRYAGPWHPAAGVKVAIRAADKDAVRWSLSGGDPAGQRFASVPESAPRSLLLFVGNAGRKVQTSTDKLVQQLNYGTFHSRPQTVALELDARPYGISGPWYAFDAAAMEPVACGARAERVAVSLEMGEYQVRAVYFFPGTVRSRCVLYASSRLVEQQAAGDRLTFACAGVAGMFYRVAVRGESPPLAVELTGPKVRSIARSNDRRATLEDFQESWYFDAKAGLLLITYQESGGANAGPCRLAVDW